MDSNRLKHQLFVDTIMPHADELHTYAYYLTGEKEHAADLLQDTLLKAFRFLDKFQQGSNAKAWLYTIMRNTYINNYRSAKRMPASVEFNDEIYDHNDRHPHKEFDLGFEHTLNDKVITALSSLPEKFKSIIILRDIEDMPYEEIAEVLDIPIGTVRSRLHRARAILFSQLRSYAKSFGYEVSDRFHNTELALAG